MTWKDIKTKVCSYQLVGAAPIIGAIAYKTDKDAWQLCSLLASQLTFLGLIFTEAFLVTKFAFKKSNQEAAKIGGIVTGAAFAALVLFAVADYFIRGKVLKEDPEDAIGDIVFLEAAATCFIPTILGMIQVEAIDAYKRHQGAEA